MQHPDRHGKNILKKVDLALIVAICAAIVSILSFILNFYIYKETRTVTCEVEAFSRNDIPLKLRSVKYTDEKEQIGHSYYISLWIQCQISNPGTKTFSINSIWAVYVDEEENMIRAPYWLDWSLFKPNPDAGVIPIEKTILPIAVEGGHSSTFIISMDIPINNELYTLWKKEFTGNNFTFGDIHLLNRNKNQSGNWSVSIEVKLANGESKLKRVPLNLYYKL